MVKYFAKYIKLEKPGAKCDTANAELWNSWFVTFYPDESSNMDIW